MNTRTDLATYEEHSQAVAPSTPMQMLQHALENGASVEMMERLLALQERWEGNQARKAFDAAMAAVRHELPRITKNRLVDFEFNGKRTTYRHEDMAGIAGQIDPILAKHGLSYRYRTSTADVVSVTCIVSHRDGHAEENTLSAGRDKSGSKNDIQAIGSTITYLQRYTLKAALGLAASHDDDGKGSEPPETITEDQAGQLRDLIEAVEADGVKFAKAMKVEAIEDLPAKRFEEAVRKLKDFGRRNGKDV